MLFGLQPIHIVFILLVALLVFGPKRLPDMGRSIGKALNEFRNGAREVTDKSTRRFLWQPGSKCDEQPGHAGERQPGPAQSVPFQAPSIRPAAGNFCIYCGSANAAEARFCNQCGQKLPENSIKPAGQSIVG